jgi:hypothetical protein
LRNFERAPCISFNVGTFKPLLAPLVMSLVNTLSFILVDYKKIANLILSYTF